MRCRLETGQTLAVTDHKTAEPCRGCGHPIHRGQRHHNGRHACTQCQTGAKPTPCAWRKKTPR